jgi:hypothetical protein
MALGDAAMIGRHQHYRLVTNAGFPHSAQDLAN